MRRYKLVGAPKGWPEHLKFRLHFAEGDVGVGEEFEAEFTPDEEWANVESGLIEVMPGKYRVVGESTVDGHEPGEEFEAAIPQAREQLLVGHIEQVKPAPPAKPRKRKKEAG